MLKTAVPNAQTCTLTNLLKGEYLMEIIVLLVIAFLVFGGKSKPKRGKVKYRRTSYQGAKYRGGRKRW
jgi:hypothetical protein